MRVLAGTSTGVFAVDSGQAGCDGDQVLQSRGVREIVRCGATLFAGTGAGLYASGDDGSTWDLAGLDTHEVWQVRAAPDGVLYATTQPAGLFRSDDGGGHWSEIETFSTHPAASEWCIPVEPPQPGRARALAIDPVDPARMWVGVEVGGIMTTEDRGETWRLSLPGDNPDLHMLWCDPGTPDTLYASTGYGRLDGIAEMVEPNAGVFRSDDRGENWSYAWSGVTPRYSRPMCVDHRPPHGLTVGSAPNAFSNWRDEGGAGAMLYRSEDRGRSWRSLCDDAHSPSAANVHGLTVDPERPGGVLAGTDTGEVWRVGDDAGWELLATGMPAVFALLAY